VTDKKPCTTVDEYINTFPPGVQEMIAQIRREIQKAAPDANETISYGIPTFDLNGKHLVHFAGWKRSLSVYPLPAGDAAFQRKIAPYKKEKSTLRFPLDEPIPYELVGEVVTLLQQEKPGNARPSDSDKEGPG